MSWVLVTVPRTEPTELSSPLPYSGQGILYGWQLYGYKMESLTVYHIGQSVWQSLKIPKGQQNPYIEEQWPKEKVQKDKQRSTKHTYKTKDRVTRIPLKTGGKLRCSGRVSSSCSTSGTRRVNPSTNPVISHE